MKLPVHIWGMDASGKLFKADANTVDITPLGACLEGISVALQRGSIIGVQCGRSQCRFRIVWIGPPGSRQEGQIGLRSIDIGKYIWGVSLERKMEEIPGPELREAI